MSRTLTAVLAGLIGFVGGGLVWTWSLWSELFRRLTFASSGGTGETADWGQPLFFIVVMGFVPACLGALLLGGLTLTLTRGNEDES